MSACAVQTAGRAGRERASGPQYPGLSTGGISDHRSARQLLVQASYALVLAGLAGWGTGALAAAIAKLATDPAARRDAATRGLARAAAFTWERCADLTAAAYSRALGSPSRPSSARPRGDSR
jgi:hypothetical protein